jgi:hypothetical protein
MPFTNRHSESTKHNPHGNGQCTHGGDAVERDAVVGPLDRQRLGQVLNSSARRGAVRQERVTLVEHEDDVDDASSVLLHVRVEHFRRDHERARPATR